ncbi:Gfo/Idh/MocA family protein [Cohnella soli]|uniref:Gfo/Idh/MocA family protein n=1 Tax=Cohnella soli TaxID=425005 RepID=A0ABW0HYI9_9BACL
MKALKIIQIGTGNFGKIWLEYVLQVEEAELVAVADVDPRNLEEARPLLQGRNVTFYNDPLQAMRETEADIVLLVTPPHTHLELTVAAAEQGLHVLMEKPIAGELAEAIKLAEFARTTDRRIMVNQNYRWRPEIAAVKAAVASGVVGPIGQIEWRFARNHTSVNFSSGWRSQYGDLFLREMSIHHFDLMRYWLDRIPVSVFAESVNPSWSWIPSGGAANALLKFEDGVSAVYSGSWVNRGPDTTWTGNVRLIGSLGAIELTNDVPSIAWEDGRQEQLAMEPMKYTELSRSLYELISAIRENREPATNAGDNLLSWLTVCAAAESAVTGVPVTIDAASASIQTIR